MTAMEDYDASAMRNVIVIGARSLPEWHAGGPDARRFARRARRPSAGRASCAIRCSSCALLGVLAGRRERGAHELQSRDHRAIRAKLLREPASALDDLGIKSLPQRFRQGFGGEGADDRAADSQRSNAVGP